jgi:hypothetical protein
MQGSVRDENPAARLIRGPALPMLAQGFLHGVECRGHVQQTLDVRLPQE